MLANNKPMKFYERIISPTLHFRIKDASKTLVNAFDTSLIPICIECTSAIHWVFPYYPRNSSLTNLRVNPQQDKTFIPQKHIKKIPIFALNFTSKIKLWGRLF